MTMAFSKNLKIGILRLLISMMLVGLAFSWMPVSHVTASTFNIPDGDVAALIDAIEIANQEYGLDTIILAENSTYNLMISDNNNMDGPNGLPSIISRIRIRGNGATIQRSGSQPFRILHLQEAGFAVLYDLTIKGGKTPDGSGKPGGGIFNRGELTLVRCKVTENRTGDGTPGMDGGPGENGTNGSSSGKGGGIYNYGDLKLIDSTVSHNFTGNGGKGGDGGSGNSGNQGGDGGIGGSSGAGGGIYSEGEYPDLWYIDYTSFLDIKNSTISHNLTGNGGKGGNGGSGGGEGANGGNGGKGGNSGFGGGIAIYWYSSFKLAHINITDNSVSDGGFGGNGGNPATGDFVGSGGNGALGGDSGTGGGFSIVADAMAPYLNLPYSVIADNIIGKGGKGGDAGENGGIGASGGNGGAGGGIFAYLIGWRYWSFISINHSMIIKNQSGRSGEPGTNGIANSKGGDGGGLWIAGNLYFNMKFCTVQDNNTGSGMINSDFAGGNGGGAYVHSSLDNVVNVSHNSIISNTTSDGGNGGGLYLHASSYMYYSSSFTNMTISGNRTGENSGSGGGIYAFNDEGGIGHWNFSHITMANNYAASGGNNIHFHNSPNDQHFISLTNVILKGDFPQFASSGIGGNIIFDRNYTYLSDDTIPLDGKANQNNIDPLITPLAYNGGFTLNHSLLDGSPALDGGYCNGIYVDQRNATRPVDIEVIPNVWDGCDIGAIEVGPIMQLFTPLIIYH